MYHFNSKDNPCFNCEERHLHCHSECDAYKEFVVKCEQAREMGKRISVINETLYEGAGRRYSYAKKHLPCSKERKHFALPETSRRKKEA